MGEFPNDTKRFLADYITSVDQLEALLLLSGQPGRAWDAADLSRELYIAPEAAAARLADLQTLGFLARTEGPVASYSYQPRTADLSRGVSQLAEVYKQRRAAVITMIYSKPLKHVQSFADAFKFWKEK